VIVMPVMPSAVPPVLVSVVTLELKHEQCPMGSGMHAKLRLVGESKTTVPVPLRETVCVPPGALSVTDSMPLRVPEAVGAKVTMIVQLAPAARNEPQVSDWLKSPLAVMPVMLSVAVP